MYYYTPDPVLHILGIIIFIVLIIWVIRLITGHNHSRFHDGQQGSRNGNSALDILKERYAKGEITKAEFDERKKDILS